MSLGEIASTLKQKVRGRLALPTGHLARLAARLAARVREALSTREGQALAAMVAGGAILRLLFLGGESLWLDEAFSVTISRRGLLDLLRMVVRTDAHPPLYYLVLKLWMGFGSSETHVRLLSALFSIAAIPVMYAVAVALYGDRRIGLLSALILAISPFQIWYAQEARMYAMLTFLVLLSAYFYIRALQDGEPRDWAGYSIATALALYTDNGAIWYLGVVALFYLLSLRSFPGRFLGWFVSNAGVVLMYMLWVPSLLWQTARVTENFWLPPPTFQTVLGTFLDFLSFNFPLVELGLLYMALILVWAYIVPGRDWQRRLLSLWLFLPLVISLSLSLRQPIFLSRNLIIASLGFALLIASTIWRFRSRTATLVLLLPLVVMNLVSVVYNLGWEQKEDWRAVARHVARATMKKPGGLVVFLPSYAEIPFTYYFEQSGVPIDTQGYPTDEVLLHPQPRQAADFDALLGGHPYVWLVVGDVSTADADWTVKNWLDTHGYIRQQDLVRDSLTVMTYVRWDKYTPTTAASASYGPQIYLPLVGGKPPLQDHEVKPGETLLEIAVRYRTTIQFLMDINDLSNPNEIEAGQEIQVPLVFEDNSSSGTPYP